MPRTIFHLAPREVFEASPGEPYAPEAFAADGFIHCTEGVANVVDVGNRYYHSDARPYVLLQIDEARVRAEIRYEDAAHIFPHIHGPLNRDAIVRAVTMPRAADGTFLTPNLGARSMHGAGRSDESPDG